MRLAFMSSAVAVLAVTSALAQSPERPRHPTPPFNPDAAPPGKNAVPAPAQAHSDSSDQTFLTRAARDGLVAIELARLAEQKAGSQSVREFARQMIANHEQTNRSLRALAEGEAAPAPDQMDA